MLNVATIFVRQSGGESPRGLTKNARTLTIEEFEHFQLLSKCEVFSISVAEMKVKKRLTKSLFKILPLYQFQTADFPRT